MRSQCGLCCWLPQGCEPASLLKFPGPCRAQERRHRHTHLWGCMCRAPGPLLWGAVGTGAQDGVWVWSGSVELGLPEEAPPFSLSLFLPSSFSTLTIC